MKTRLYDEFIKRLIEVNDESKTNREHEISEASFYGWKEGVKDATDFHFNGDFYYINLIDTGVMEERPMCCGKFLDWKSKKEANPCNK